MNKQPTTIRTYLLRGAFLLSLAFVIVMPLALGQTRSRGSKPSVAANMSLPQTGQSADGVLRAPARPSAPTATDISKAPAAPSLPVRQSSKVTSGATGGSPVKILRTPTFPQVILYDQYNNDLNNGIVSADRTDSPSLSAEAADNFVVPGGQTWTITEVDIRSPAGFPTPTSFAVHFYTDASGLPGTEVYVATGLAVVGNPDYIITLTTPAVLTSGTYWVSAVGTITLNNWYWEGRSITSNGFATAWRNPLGGYGLGCTDWARLQDCIGFSWPDQMFRIVGTTGGGTPTPTPTASPTCNPAWQNEPNMLASRAFASAAVANNNLYVLTGFDNSSPYVTETDYFNGTTWAIGAPIPVPHSQSKAAAVGNNIYVPGGYNFGQINNMQIYDTVANTWSSGAPLPDNRAGSATAAFNGKVYIIAGFDAFFTPQNQVWEYDPVANTYTTKTPMPTGSGNVPGALLGNEIFVVGGAIPNTAAYAYNPTTDTWRSITPPSPADCQAGGAFALNGQLWLVGCLGQDGTVAKVYDPVSDTWSLGPPLNTSQEGGSATALYNARGFVAGGAAGGNPSTTVESIGPCPSATPTPTPTPTPTVTPTPTPTPGQIILRAGTQRFPHREQVHLRWTGATSATVNIFRNDVRIATVVNTGSYDDVLTERGTYTYQVCEARTRNCSNEVTVNFF